MDLNMQSILNVDDYPPGLYARTKLLRQAGFDVIEASSGGNALKMVAEQRPALILLDVNLPDMSGFEVCRRIKTNPHLAATTVLHLSASSIENQHMVHGLDSGADSYLVEPIDPAVLVATIKAFLRARKAEEALRRSNEDLERFAYMVTHELNEPLRSITMHTQLLTEHLGVQFDESSTESFRYIVESAHRMRAFINDLLRYSQATHAGSDVRPLSVDALVDQALFNLNAAIQDADVSVTRDALPVVIADAQLAHVLQNLISNAIKYQRKGVKPEVHISSKRENGVWTFAVRDNGIGIDPAYQKSIFHIFRRLHSRDIPGSGIGLAFAQKIVEKNGGTMWVESELGVGSTFYFTIVEDREAAAATP
jgi:two-component system sensor histidine kinase/response regulator